MAPDENLQPEHFEECTLLPQARNRPVNPYKKRNNSLRSIAIELGDIRPDHILELHNGWARQYRRRRLSLFAIFNKPQHPHLTVGEIAVAAAVSAEQCRANSHDLIASGDHSGCLKTCFDQISIQIDVGSDVMRNRPGVVAQADAPIERRGSEPDRPAFLAVLQHLLRARGSTS